MRPALVGTYGSLAEANLIRAKLESAGIEAFVEADSASSTIPVLEISEGVRVLVREADMAEALEVLERLLPPGE
ncbi:MAG: putative signal transducing protein [Acidimicrobiia bacterium]